MPIRQSMKEHSLLVLIAVDWKLMLPLAPSFLPKEHMFMIQKKKATLQPVHKKQKIV